MMVTEKAPALTEEQQIQEYVKTTEFDDRTQPDLVAEKPAEPVSPEPQTPEPPAESAPVPVTQTAEKPQEPAKPRLSDLPEWREAQSKYDRRIAELERRNQEAEARQQQEIARTAIESATEAHLKAQEEQWARQLNDPELARTNVRSQQNVQAVRGYYETRQQLAMQQQVAAQQEQTLAHAGRIFAADEFSREFNVAPEDRQVLMTAATPAAMRLLAQRLGKAAADRKTETDAAKGRVPPENRATRLETGEQGAKPGGNFWDLLTSAQDKHYSEMSAAERQAIEQAYRGNYPPPR